MKTKVSVTVDQDRLARAKELSGSNNVSAVVDSALEAFIIARLEQKHIDGYERFPQDDETVGFSDGATLSDIPWDEE